MLQVKQRKLYHSAVTSSVACPFVSYKHDYIIKNTQNTGRNCFKVSQSYPVCNSFGDFFRDLLYNGLQTFNFLDHAFLNFLNLKNSLFLIPRYKSR